MSPFTISLMSYCLCPQAGHLSQWRTLSHPGTEKGNLQGPLAGQESNSLLTTRSSCASWEGSWAEKTGELGKGILVTLL